MREDQVYNKKTAFFTTEGTVVVDCIDTGKVVVWPYNDESYKYPGGITVEKLMELLSEYPKDAQLYVLTADHSMSGFSTPVAKQRQLGSGGGLLVKLSGTEGR